MRYFNVDDGALIPSQVEVSQDALPIATSANT